jgi:hypothetical protein
MTTEVEPCPLIEPDAVHDQRVSLPAAHGIPHEARRRVGWQSTAIEKNLSVAQVLVKDCDEVGSLCDLDPQRAGSTSDYASRTTGKHPTVHGSSLP